MTEAGQVAPPKELPAGPCLEWEPIPRAVRRPWTPPEATLAELRAKPGKPARVYTFVGPKQAANPANRVNRGDVDDLPVHEWRAYARAWAGGSGLWLVFDRRRADEPVETDRRSG